MTLDIVNFVHAHTVTMSSIKSKRLLMAQSAQTANLGGCSSTISLGRRSDF